MALQRKPRVLVCCLGNICRSPLGEAVLKKKAQEQGIELEVDSAGTIDFHTGAKPDPRSRKVGEARGYDFSGSHARKVKLEDFEYFDVILAADHSNLANLMSMCPEAHQNKISLFLSHSEGQYSEIPDPYYGETTDFEFALDLIEQASDGVLALCQQLKTA